MKKNLDDILRTSLTPAEEASDRLNQQILALSEQKGVINMKGQRKRRLGQAAAAAIAVVFLTGGAVYAGAKFNFFENVFGRADTAPIKQYVEVASEQGEGVYHKETDVYAVSVDYFMYSDETDSGILQFTVKNKTGDGRKWYKELDHSKKYEQWYKNWEWYEGKQNLVEIVDREDEQESLLFQVIGLEEQHSEVYLDKSKSDENTAVCQMVFNDFGRTDFSCTPIQLSVSSSHVVRKKNCFEVKDVMKLDIPKRKSLPAYVWRDKGHRELVLSNFSYFLTLQGAPAETIVKSAGDEPVIDSSEVSIQMKDGSEYIIHSKKEKKINWLYGTNNTVETINDRGQWHGFANILDLEQVESFTVDGKVFMTKDAELYKGAK